jgi:hypothetical protein
MVVALLMCRGGNREMGVVMFVLGRMILGPGDMGDFLKWLTDRSFTWN